MNITKVSHKLIGSSDYQLLFFYFQLLFFYFNLTKHYMKTEDKEFLEKIGGKIRLFRELKGFTLENMADEVGISVEAYRKIEKGITNVQMCRLKQITEILKVSMENIFNTDSNQTINFTFKTGNGFGNMHSNITVNENDTNLETIKQSVDSIQTLVNTISEKLDK